MNKLGLNKIHIVLNYFIRHLNYDIDLDFIVIECATNEHRTKFHFRGSAYNQNIKVYKKKIPQKE